jgi:hypothetical protein
MILRRVDCRDIVWRDTVFHKHALRLILETMKY